MAMHKTPLKRPSTPHWHWLLVALPVVTWCALAALFVVQHNRAWDADSQFQAAQGLMHLRHESMRFHDVLAHKYGYPEDVYELDWTRVVSDDDRAHLSSLQHACISHKDSVVPWKFSANAETAVVNEGDAHVLERLRECPDVDVFVPRDIRGHGYCEDAAAFTEYLHARMLPQWVLDGSFFDPQLQRNVSYHQLCPNTPLLIFNHYWNDVDKHPQWPATKPIYLMPNIEMYELESKHLWNADLVLCKTRICDDYINKWYWDNGNPKHTDVIYTRFTSSDLALNARLASKNTPTQSIAPQDFANPVFLHTSGNSVWKGTEHILRCWLDRPDFPTLELHIGEIEHSHLKRNYAPLLEPRANIHLHVGDSNATQFNKLVAEAAYFLCPSVMEGYGHYINQARAAGGLVVTTNVPPMNELITPSSGVLVAAARSGVKGQFLGGQDTREHALRKVPGFVGVFDDTDVCRAVDHALKDQSVQDRQRRAARARQQYLYDTAVFAEWMKRVRRRARAGISTAPARTA